MKEDTHNSAKVGFGNVKYHGKEVFAAHTSLKMLTYTHELVLLLSATTTCGITLKHLCILPHR